MDATRGRETEAEGTGFELPLTMNPRFVHVVRLEYSIAPAHRLLVLRVFKRGANLNSWSSINITKHTAIKKNYKQA